jgi:hypothetical protein
VEEVRDQGDVRALQSEVVFTEERRRLSVAGYLSMLAEQVRSGRVRSFSVQWSGEELRKQLESEEA